MEIKNLGSWRSEAGRSGSAVVSAWSALALAVSLSRKRKRNDTSSSPVVGNPFFTLSSSACPSLAPKIARMRVFFARMRHAGVLPKQGFTVVLGSDDLNSHAVEFIREAMFERDI